MATFGFVAGTLVHTDKGLVPIEQIKVGDKVLSKHENREGGVAYKRVASTFKSAEKQKIIRVVYTRPQVIDNVPIADDYGYESVIYYNSPSTDELYLYCTENHPFWTREYGWVTAVDLAGNNKHQPEKQCTLINYQGISFFSAEHTLPTPLIKTTIPDVAVQINRQESNLCCYGDMFGIIDFRSGKPVLIDTTNCSGFNYYWIHDGFSKEQDWLELNEASDVFKHPFIDEGNFYVGEDIHIYEQGGFSSYKEITETYLEKARISDSYNAENDYYQATVYNIEVEDHHTYYVGKDGTWVHALP